MNTHKKKIYIALLIIFSMLFIFLISLTYIERTRLPKKYKIKEAYIINSGEIKKFIDIATIIREHPDSLSLLAIQEIFLSNPYIKSCHLSVNYNGKAIISLQPRKIIAKINNIYNKQFLLDYDNEKIPIAKNLELLDIVEIKGSQEKYEYLKEITDNMTLQASTITKYILADSSLKNRVIELKIVENKNIRLLVKSTIDDKKYNFILGNDMQIEKKIKNIHIFFKDIMPKFKTKNYSWINLKYNNQIICYK
ncbi:MAG: cell division protein FtsQ/DivIB [Solitalea-like symbiont of Acarus siro]